MSAPEAAAPAGRLGAELRSFLTGVMFLTRLPCPAWVGHDAEWLARSTVYFPAIGVLVGAWGGAVFWLASLGWPGWIAAVLSTAATVWLTGAFHEDGMADACDGFGGGWGTEQILAIMKDSRVGSYGVVGLGLTLLAKLGLLATFEPLDAVKALVAAHVLARWSSLPLIYALPYVREAGAKGKPFAASVTPLRLAIATGITLAAVVPLLGVQSLPALAATLAVTALAGRYFRAQIGGITGDCLGAANQVVEVAVYLALAFHFTGGAA